MLWSFNFRENTDILRYRDWGRIGYLYNLADTYKTDHLSFGTIPANMPPGSLYTIQAMYNLNIQVSKVILKIGHAKEGSLSWVNGPLLNAFLRFPSILADLIIGFLIYKVVSLKNSKKSGIIASSIFLFNPVILYNSAFWGQMDAINNSLFYFSLYLLLTKKYFPSILLYLLSLYVKLSLLPFLPVFFLFLFLMKKEKQLKLLLSTIISVFFILITTFPMSLNPIAWFIQFLSKNAVPEMANITSFSFNFWWVVLKPWILIGKPSNLFNFSEIRLINSPLDSVTFFYIPLSIWGYFIFIIFSIPFAYRIFKLKQRINASLIFLIFSNLALLAYLFLPNMHERYLYPIFPLLATYVGLKHEYLWAFIVLTILNFINLYIVWHPMTIPFISYNLMNNKEFQWSISLFTLFIGLLFYTKSIKTLYAVGK